MSLWRMSVKQYQRPHAFAVAHKLLCHLNGDQPANRPATQKIWALWLYPSNLLDVKRRHVLDTVQRLADAPRRWRLQTVERPVLSQGTGKVDIAKHTATNRMNAEEWCSSSLRLDCHYDTRRITFLRPRKQLCKTSDGWVLEQACQRQRFLETIPYHRHHPHGNQGVAANLEKVFIDANGVNGQHLLPDLYKFCFH